MCLLSRESPLWYTCMMYSVARVRTCCTCCVLQAMFAGFVPEIMEIIGRRERYGGTYDKPAGVKYVNATSGPIASSPARLLRSCAFYHASTL